MGDAKGKHYLKIKDSEEFMQLSAGVRQLLAVEYNKCRSSHGEIGGLAHSSSVLIGLRVLECLCFLAHFTTPAYVE